LFHVQQQGGVSSWTRPSPSGGPAMTHERADGFVPGRQSAMPRAAMTHARADGFVPGRQSGA